ncbi:hypothetical protein HJD18_11395 [Thermoleophilia bacterium SCSIO 60948]|nr:hypothetical protein HJD18_11395 [Thermoleophilia bacterium SCSIO 60948]
MTESQEPQAHRPPPQSNGAPPPPAGDAPGLPAHRCLEWCPICRTAEVLRENATPELRASLAEAQQEALLTLRALIDTYLSQPPRPDAPDPPPEEQGIRDIPIG